MNSPNSSGTPATPLTRHTSKSWFTAFLLGIFIGLAVIVPGVSGSTIAIIFGLYTALLYAIGNILNDFKRCVLFLIPIALGIVVGFLAGFIVIQKIFGKYMFQVVCLFVGLMAGAIPALTREIKGVSRTPVRSVLLPVGVLVPLAVGIVSIFLTGDAESAETFTSFPLWRYLCYLPLGFVVAVTQIVPGLSATAVLMACGQFRPILNSLHLHYVLENPAVLGLYAALGIGFLAGLILVSRLFSKILERFKVTAFFFITGLSLGSIVSMFINPDMVEVYQSWGNGEGNPVLSVIVGIVLLAAGFVLSALLTRYELKKGAEKSAD